MIPQQFYDLIIIFNIYDDFKQNLKVYLAHGLYCIRKCQKFDYFMDHNNWNQSTFNDIQIFLQSDHAWKHLYNIHNIYNISSMYMCIPCLIFSKHICQVISEIRIQDFNKYMFLYMYYVLHQILKPVSEQTIINFILKQMEFLHSLWTGSKYFQKWTKRITIPFYIP